MHRCLQMFQLWKHCSSSSWPGKNPKTKRSEIGRPSLHTRGRRGRNSRCGGGLWTLKKHWNVLFDGLLSQGISINSKNLHDLYDFVAKSLAVVGWLWLKHSCADCSKDSAPKRHWFLKYTKHRATLSCSEKFLKASLLLPFKSSLNAKRMFFKKLRLSDLTSNQNFELTL